MVAARLRWKHARFALGGAVLAAGFALVPAADGQVLPDGEPLCGIAQPDGSAPDPAADDGRLRIVTLNTLHSETDDGDQSLGDRLPLLADAIVGAKADVVGAQEVTRNLTFDGSDEYPQKHGLVAERLAQAVADRTGEPWSWCWSLSNPHVPGTPDLIVGGGNPLDEQAAANGNIPEGGDFSEGLAALTRFSIDHASFRRLLPRSYETVGCVELDLFCPLDSIFDSRQVLFTRITTPDGGLDLFTTHVAHHLTELSPQTKLLQAQQIVAIAAELATDDPLPDVLTGDFNSIPTSDAVSTVTAVGFVDSYHEHGGPECVPATGEGACSGGPADGSEVWTDEPVRPMHERIDYVFVRPPDGCDLHITDSARIADEPAPLDDGRYLWPTDHYSFVSEPVCATASGPATPAPTVSDGRLAATGGASLAAFGLLLLAAGWVVRRLLGAAR